MYWARSFNFLILFIIFAPIVFLFKQSVLVQPEILNHLLEYDLGESLTNTLLLGLLVLVFTGVLGVSFAWILVRYEFWGRSFFEKALILPLAIPAYVFAFVYVGLLDYSGELQTFLRSVWGDSINIISVRSFGGLVGVLALSLYPYVLLITKRAFASMSQDQYDCARSLGHGPFSIFFNLCLRSSFPWIAVSLILVAMECFADFGAASVIGVQVFTTSIYKSWFGFHSLPSASILALTLLFLAFMALYVKQKYSKKGEAYQISSGGAQLTRVSVSGSGVWLFPLLCCVLFLLAVAVPLSQVFVWSLQSVGGNSWLQLFSYFLNTALFAFLGGFLCLVIVLFLVLSQRFKLNPKWINTLQAWLPPLGYALPGSVLAVGVYLFMSSVQDALKVYFVSGTLITLIVGYLVRFLGVGYGVVDSAQKRIDHTLDEVATSLAINKWKQVFVVHLPLLKKSLTVGFLLTFIEIAKEMPLTLMTRPYGWDTLAVKVYEYTSEGEWELASSPALLIVLLGLIPVVMLDHKSQWGQQ